MARSLRIMLEEHLYWSLVVENYVSARLAGLESVMRTPGGLFGALFMRVYKRLAIAHMSGLAHAQGMLRLGKGNAQRVGIEDLEAVSTFLGTKSYLMGGEKPSEVDCALFGFVAHIVRCSPEGSIFKTLVEKRLTNLNQHCLRMRAKFFPDWVELIAEKTADEASEPLKKDDKMPADKAPASKYAISAAPSSEAKASPQKAPSRPPAPKK